MQFNIRYLWDVKVQASDDNFSARYANDIKTALGLNPDLDTTNKNSNVISFSMENSIEKVREDFEKIQMFLLLQNAKQEILKAPNFNLNGKISAHPVFDMGPGFEKIGLGGMMDEDSKKDLNFELKDNIFYRNNKIAFELVVSETNKKIVLLKEEYSNPKENIKPVKPKKNKP